MTARFYYTIITDELTVNDIETVAEVYRAYGLQPDNDSDSVSVSTVVTLPSSSSTEAFHDEFSDAVWSAVGRYVPIHFSHTYVEEPETYIRLGQDEYAQWQKGEDSHENIKTRPSSGADTDRQNS